MIVEFIGCSGAGKTTLMHAVRDCLSASSSVVTAWDLVTDRPGRRWVTNQTAVNLLADGSSLAPFIRGFGRNRDFVRFSLRRLRRHAPSAFPTINYTRNVVRKVGVHELARRNDTDTTVLVDEGTVLIAYQLYVYSGGPYSPSEIEEFARLVPAPDLLVYVKAPISTLIDRSMSRTDQRRELVGQNRQQVGHWIEQANEVFEAVAATKTLRDRVLVVENPNGSLDQRGLVAQRIAAMIGDVNKPDTQDPLRRPDHDGN